MTRTVALAQLRHLYHLLLQGRVTDTAQVARELLGPVIEALEQDDEKIRQELTKLADDLCKPPPQVVRVRR